MPGVKLQCVRCSVPEGLSPDQRLLLQLLSRPSPGPSQRRQIRRLLVGRVNVLEPNAHRKNDDCV
jgi:hypothetical protein